MNVWDKTNLNRTAVDASSGKGGLKFIFDNKADKDVKKAFRRFMKWAEAHYYFPVKLYVFVRSAYRVKASDGDMVCGRSFMPEDRISPFIEVAVGDFAEMKASDGRDNAIASLLCCLIHEITHYFQFLNDLNCSDDLLEKQAEICAEDIMGRYEETRMHP